MSTGLKANSDGSAAIQVGGTDVITLTSGGAATFVTSPTTVQAGTAAAPSITFSGDTNTGIYSPGADQVAIATGGSKRFEVDAAGNAGLGVAPSAWGSSYKAFQVGKSAAVWGAPSADIGWFSVNTYFDNTNYRYISSDKASFYQQYQGAHAWYNAPSGTAGNTITFTQVMAVEGGKSLALEGATSQSGTGITFPATQSASSNANTLDDYEEGTWTPAVNFNNTSSTLDTVTGDYIKIGRFVKCSATFRITAKGAGVGSMQITGLPFTSVSSSTTPYHYGNMQGDQLALPTGYASIMPYVDASSTNIRALSLNNAGHINVTNTHINTNCTIYMFVVYMAAN